MFEWLNNNVLYWHWIVFGLALITIELMTPVFVMLWLGIAGILVGTLSLFLPLNFSTQLIIWVALSTFSLLLWHQFISPKITTQTFAGLSKEAMIGQIGMVISFNGKQERGVLKFPAPIVGSDEWEFIYSGTLQNGDKVKVDDILGNSLMVTTLS